jgi:hypothetical protein
MNAQFSLPLQSFSGPRPLDKPASSYCVAGAFTPPPAKADALSRFCRSVTRFLPRFGRQAMIGYPRVRNTPLIALPSNAARPFGFCEIETPRFQDAAKGGRGSASSFPQGCGKFAAFTRDGLVDWLRQEYPRSTCQNVEAETGIPAATVENWLIGRSRPTVDHFVRLIFVFGPALLQTSVTRPAGWMERAAQTERALELDQEIERLRLERDKLRQVAR